MLMFGIFKMATGSQCLLFCVSIVLQPVFLGHQKVRKQVNIILIYLEQKYPIDLNSYLTLTANF